ncbi:unnamed protein product, partial [Adineta ricciae]
LNRVTEPVMTRHHKCATTASFSVSAAVEATVIIHLHNNASMEQYAQFNKCYDPSNQICLNNSLCWYPSRVCNGQCLLDTQLCVNNATTCTVANNSMYYTYGYGASLAQSCNGTCYDPPSQTCQSGSIMCIDNCFGKCYNASAQRCFNGTLCSVQQSICTVQYASWGMVYNPPSLQCYYPSNQVCLNNSLCWYPFQLNRVTEPVMTRHHKCATTASFSVSAAVEATVIIHLH